MTEEQIDQSIMTIEELQQTLNIIRIKRQILLNSYDNILKPKQDLPDTCETCKILNETNENI